MNLTPHFTLAELTATSQPFDNTPTGIELDNLKRLASVLEQVRSLAGAPITVTSGYRSLAVNKAVKGSSTSAHVKGLAADIRAKGMTSRQLANLIKDSDIQFDQLILEYPKKSGSWVHIGLSTNKPRRQLLTIDEGAGYQVGIL